VGYKILADNNQVVFFYESGTYGSASGNRTWIGLVQTHDATESIESVPIRYQGSNTRNVDLFAFGKKSYKGKIEYYPQDFRMLAFALGSNCDGTGSGHFITETNSDNSNYAIPAQSLSSFTLEDTKKTPTTGSNFNRTYKGCLIDTFELSISEGEVVKCNVDYIAQDMTFSSGAITSGLTSNTQPYMWSNALFSIPSGTSYTNSTEVTFTVKNNLDEHFPLNGSRVIDFALPLNRDYEIKTKLILDSANAKTLYDTYYIGGGSFNSFLSLVGEPGSCYISFSGCKITDMSIPSPVEGIHEEEITITPLKASAIIYDGISKYNGW